MSNNCLITKLNGVVQNDNLPVYKTIRIDLNDTTDIPNVPFVLCIGGSKAVHVKFNITMHRDTITGPIISEETVPAGGVYVYCANKNEVPVNGLKSAIIVSGEIYNLYGISLYYSNAFNINELDHKSLYYSDSLISDTIRFDTYDGSIKPNVKVISISDSVYNRYNYDSLFKEDNEIVYISGGYVSMSGIMVGINSSSLKKCVNLKYINARINGDITELPLYVCSLMTASSIATGKLEDFVNYRRTHGLQNGTLKISECTNLWNITYNNIPIKNLDSTIMPRTSSNETYLVWDAVSMRFTNVKPADFVDITSPYYALMGVINGTI